jgi:hypothetical protein
MAKHDDLDLQFAIRTRPSRADHAAEQRVEDGKQDEGANLHRRGSGRE